MKFFDFNLANTPASYFTHTVIRLFILVLVLLIGFTYVVIAYSLAPCPIERCSLHTSITVILVRYFFLSFPSFKFDRCFRFFCIIICESCRMLPYAHVIEIWINMWFVKKISIYRNKRNKRLVVLHWCQTFSSKLVFQTHLWSFNFEFKPKKFEQCGLKCRFFISICSITSNVASKFSNLDHISIFRASVSLIVVSFDRWLCHTAEFLKFNPHRSKQSLDSLGDSVVRSLLCSLVY